MRMMSSFKNKSVLVTGGAGFIGSHLAERLVELGSNVTIYDSFSKEYGANRFNISHMRDDIEVVEGNVENKDKLEKALEGKDIIYHLAAQLSRKISNGKPKKDLTYNNIGTINLLESIDSNDGKKEIVYTGSQAQYGKTNGNVIDEKTKQSPVDIYGANKLACEHYMKIYNRRKEISCYTLRLTNVYGPRGQIQNPNYGVINQFIKSAIEDETLNVFDPGSMMRDFIYVSDVVDCMTECIKTGNAGKPYIVGSGSSTTIKNLAELIVKVSSRGSVRIAPWPKGWSDIKVGDIKVDISSTREDMDWNPNTGLEEGLEETISYYQKHFKKYL